MLLPICSRYNWTLEVSVLDPKNVSRGVEMTKEEDERLRGKFNGGAIGLGPNGELNVVGVVDPLDRNNLILTSDPRFEAASKFWEKGDMPSVELKGELFFVDENGKKQDAALHEEILAGDHSAATEIGKEVARRAGLTEAEIEMLYS